MSEELEDLREGLDLPLFLKLDLCMHEGEFFSSLLRAKVSANFDELHPGFLDLVLPDQKAGTVRKKGLETDE